MDDAGRLRRRVADANRPGAHFLFAGGEVGLQSEQVVGRANERADAALLARRAPSGTRSPSSGDRSTRSLSICALMTTASHARCVCTYSRTFFTYGFESAVARSDSFTLHAKMVGLSVRRKNCFAVLALVRRERDRQDRFAGIETRFDFREHRLFGRSRPCRRA